MFGKPHPEQDQIDLYGAARLRSGRLLREITTPVSAGQNSAYDLLQPLLIHLDYLRAEVAADARQRPMKLWLSTANGL